MYNTFCDITHGISNNSNVCERTRNGTGSGRRTNKSKPSFQTLSHHGAVTMLTGPSWHQSMDRLSPVTQFQNSTDCLLLQLMQSHQRHSTRSRMPYRPTPGCVGSRLTCIHLSSARYAIGCQFVMYDPTSDTTRFCRVPDRPVGWFQC